MKQRFAKEVQRVDENPTKKASKMRPAMRYRRLSVTRRLRYLLYFSIAVDSMVLQNNSGVTILELFHHAYVPLTIQLNPAG